MSLIQSFEKNGNILFKYRGQIPIAIFILAIPFVVCGNDYWYTYLFSIAGQNVRITLAAIAILVTCAGLALRAYTVGTTPKGTSGRNTQSQVAKHLNTQGIYSTVRHPLYFANYLIWAGILIYSASICAFIFVSLAYWIYYERIMFAEEAFLRQQFGDDFEEWAMRVPAFIPRFSLFQKGDMRFSFKTFLRREYATIFSTVFSFTLVDYIIHFKELLKHACTWTDWLLPSLYILAACLVVTLVLRTLKHNTKVLNADKTRD